MMAGNPCANAVDYRLSAVSALPELKELDEVEITAFERRMALKSSGL
jgi:hypothetical protein